MAKLLLEAKLIVIALQEFRSEIVELGHLPSLLGRSAEPASPVAVDLIESWLGQEHSVIQIHSLLLERLHLD